MSPEKIIEELSDFCNAHVVTVVDCPDQGIYEYGFDDPICYAIKEAIMIVKKYKNGMEMLKDERNRCIHDDYSRGRITGFYDVLGINYAD